MARVARRDRYPVVVIVVAPATSANLGPGFDVLGMAVALPFIFAIGGECEDMLTARDGHPAIVAYREAGGISDDDDLFWRSPIPPGRGLGFSGAARVAGAFAAYVEAGRCEPEARQLAFRLATELEGHPDNAAPSAFGGVCVSSGDVTKRLTVHPDVAELRLVVWSPDSATATKASRAALADVVERSDAIFNLGRCGLLIAAMSTGDLALMRYATQDRLHQDARLAARPDCAQTLATFLDDERVVAAWLSGSGPTVAALVRPDEVEAVSTTPLPPGHVRVLAIADHGVRVYAK